MRIHSGKYKGKQLQSAKDLSIRPTTSKIKEYIFDLLDDAVIDARVLDLFCGSGSLGMEALSRGAGEVVFVDNAASSLRVLRKNINQVKPVEPFRIVRKDCLGFLKGNAHPFDLIFADPPFKWGDFGPLFERIFKPENLADYGIFVLESEKSHQVNWESDLFEVLRQKTFDRSVITFLSRKTDE